MSFRRPGIHINEINDTKQLLKSPETAPLFVGYTERAGWENEHFRKPLLLAGQRDFQSFFGGRPPHKFVVSPEPSPFANVQMGASYFGIFPAAFAPEPVPGTWLLYDAVRLFWASGGNRCYVVSTGNYESYETPNPLTLDALSDALTEGSLNIPPPGLLLMPDAILLPEKECYSLQTQMLQTSGSTENHMSLLDVYGGYQKGETDMILREFRSKLQSPYLKNGAAYFPWLKTQLYDAEDFSMEHIYDAEGFEKLMQNAGWDSVNEEEKEWEIIAEGIAEAANWQPPAAAMAGVLYRSEKLQGCWRNPVNTPVSGATGVLRHLPSPELKIMLEPNDSSMKINPIVKSEGKRKPTVKGGFTLAGDDPHFQQIGIQRLKLLIKNTVRLAAADLAEAPNFGEAVAVLSGKISEFLKDLHLKGAFPAKEASQAYQVSVGPIGRFEPQRSEVMGTIIRVAFAPIHPGEFVIVDVEQEYIS